MSDKFMMIYHDLMGNIVALAIIMGVNYVSVIINEQIGPMIGDIKLRVAIIGGLKDFLTLSVYKIFAEVPHLKL